MGSKRQRVVSPSVSGVSRGEEEAKSPDHMNMLVTKMDLIVQKLDQLVTNDSHADEQTKMRDQLAVTVGKMDTPQSRRPRARAIVAVEARVEEE